MSKSVDVILIKDHKGLGKFGDTKKVRLGYAKNFLLPQAVALLPNQDNLYRFEALKKKEEKRRAQQLGTAEDLRKQLADKTLQIAAKAHDGGKLYGSVTPSDVLELIKTNFKIELEKKYLRMPEHLKEVGEFEITIEPCPEVFFTIKLTIEAAAEPEKK